MRCAALLCSALLVACGGEASTLPDAGAPLDAGPADAGPADAGTPDAGLGPGEVATSAGVVRGRAEGEVWAFLGIPYAAPPVGERRFAPPAPHPGWDAPRDAVDLGPVCPQRDRRGDLVGDEDCLTLNVWTTRPAEPKPVMVWIHGGGFVQGSAAVPLYDGAALARDGDVVVVSLSYRLGALGFLALDALREAGAPGANFGLRDQIAALEWVRDEIAAFGGDPSQVTIFGESAGGVSVCAHLGMEASAGLFHRAIIQSGGGCFSFAEWPRAAEVSADLVAEVGCDGSPDVLACLRGVDARALTEALSEVPSSGLGLPDFGPALDGALLTRQTYDAFLEGAGNEVPIITGSNADEGVIFTQGVRVPTWDAFERLVEARLGPNLGPRVAALYPPADHASPKAAYDTLLSDLGFNCLAESFVRLVAGGAEPAWLYYFTHRLAGQAGTQGSLHGHEIPFVFGTFDAFPGYPATEADRRVSAAMLGAWARFAHTGAPDAAHPWPAYDPSSDSVLVFDDPVTRTDTFRDGRCDELRALRLVP